MPHGLRYVAAASAVALLAACQTQTDGAAVSQDAAPTYDGIETRLLDDGLVNVRAQMSGSASAADVQAYARCAAAQYTLIRGYSFARHVRTTLAEEAGLRVADAVYTISSELPGGLQTLEAQVVAADCAEQGIPSV